ncbi:hypothetical protein NKDENANG_02138 [Candidatus Entotheonellaceae bacterium PAL068K]
MLCGHERHIDTTDGFVWESVRHSDRAAYKQTPELFHRALAGDIEEVLESRVGLALRHVISSRRRGPMTTLESASKRAATADPIRPFSECRPQRRFREDLATFGEPWAASRCARLKPLESRAYLQPNLNLHLGVKSLPQAQQTCIIAVTIRRHCDPG